MIKIALVDGADLFALDDHVCVQNAPYALELRGRPQTPT